MSNERVRNLTAEHRQHCCDEFVKITKTDENLAISYLFDTKYDLKLALEMYNLEEHIVIEGYTVRCSQIKVTDFRVISWNLEGLEKTELKKRTHLAIMTILKSKANVVMLQELVVENENEIRKYFQEDYDIFIDQENAREHYYCGILVRKHPNIKIINDSFQIEHFENSSMGRNLLKLTIIINNIPVKFITGHLESTKEYSTQRKAQLQKAFQEMQNGDTNFSIFAGDLNLRDKEILEIGDLPNNIVDLWEATGKRPEAKFTWDPQRNLNASQYCPGAFGVRFDRMYFYSNNAQNMRPVHFSLDGLEKIKSGIRFPSDHWAIVGHFQFQ